MLQGENSIYLLFLYVNVFYTFCYYCSKYQINKSYRVTEKQLTPTQCLDFLNLDIIADGETDIQRSHKIIYYNQLRIKYIFSLEIG